MIYPDLEVIEPKNKLVMELLKVIESQIHQFLPVVMIFGTLSNSLRISLLRKISWIKILSVTLELSYR